MTGRSSDRRTGDDPVPRRIPFLRSRNDVRLAFVAVVLLCAAVVANGAAGGLSTVTAEDVPRAPPREGHTVITESARAGTIIAYAPDGSLLYFNNTRTKYFDVDPVSGESLTVEYAATDTVHSEGPTCSDPPCARNVVERANLSTGETEAIYRRYDHKENAGEWHDHVRVDDLHVLIADIVEDQVFMVDTETEMVEWLWDAQGEFPVEGGGPYPDDWAHINDVSVLDDGRVMISLRNQDQVVLVDPETGMDPDWTLGSEDDHDVLFEQHNPDYIPAENGGPAVVVSDSENGRVQEFQRENGGWERTWVWSDEQLQWPRDADRLPDGNTLIVDTHGKRVIEVDPAGEVAWEVPTTLPYDAERLETGDESTGGESAAPLGLESRVAEADEEGFTVLGAVARLVKAILPHGVFNAVLYVSPPWMGRPEFAAVTVGALSVFAWVPLELSWRLSSLGVGVRSPLYRRK